MKGRRSRGKIRLHTEADFEQLGRASHRSIATALVVADVVARFFGSLPLDSCQLTSEYSIEVLATLKGCPSTKYNAQMLLRLEAAYIIVV